MARCPAGHEGAVVLFTSIDCAVCAGRKPEYDPNSVCRFFGWVVSDFFGRHGRIPKESRIPPSWRETLANWVDAPEQCRWVQLLDGAEGVVRMVGRDSAGVLRSQEYRW